MRKKVIQGISLLLALCLVGMSGCSTKPKEASSTLSSSESVTSESSAVSDDSDASAVSSGTQASTSSGKTATTEKRTTSQIAINTNNYKKHITISMISRDLHMGNSNTIGQDEVIQTLEKKFNCTFKFVYVPSPKQTEVFEKLNMMLSTGTIPDVMEMRNDMTLTQNIYNSLRNNGKIINVGDIVTKNKNKYPNLYNLVSDPQSKADYASDGKLWMLPRSMGVIDHGFIIRKDWLDKLGLQVPKTTDDLYNVLKAFVQKDPEGTKNVGLTLPNTWWFGHIYDGFIGSQNWIASNGKYTRTEVSNGQKDAFKYLHKLYNDGLLDKEVFTMKSESDAIAKFNAGKAGVTMMGVSYGEPQILPVLQKTNPKAKLVYVNIKGPKAYCREDISYLFEGCIINKNTDYNRILDMIEYVLSPEGEKLMDYGVAGVHYTTDKSGNMVINYEKRKSEGWERSPHGLKNMFNIEALIDQNNYGSEYKNILNFWSLMKKPGQTVSDPLYGYTFKTASTIGSKPADVFNQYATGFITGMYDIDQKWSTYVNKYMSSGIQAEIDEANQHFKVK